MDLEKINSSRLIGLFGRIQDKLGEGYEAGVEPEVLAFSQISDILNITQQKLLESRQERNNILEGPLSAEAKRELIDILINQENILLKITIDTLADMDIEYIFDKSFGLLGPAENAVKTNPRERKN
jgi:hypothetical protein